MSVLMHRKIITVVLLTLGIWLNVSAQKPDDIYTALDRLHSELVLWAASADSARAATPYWRVKQPFGQHAKMTAETDSGRYYTIENPLYLDLLTTQLKIFVSDSGERALIPVFLPHVKVFGKQIRFDDSLTVIYQGDGDVPPVLSEIFEQRLNLYRSLGFVYPPDNPAAVLEATVYYHAKSVDSLFYESWDHFLLTLRNLCYGQGVYAGPLSVSESDLSYTIEFYLCIPFPEASTHHFFTIREEFAKADNFSKSRIVAHFTPYVRLDNIKEMFGKDQGATLPNDRIPLKFND